MRPPINFCLTHHYSQNLHSFDAPDLNLNIILRPATTGPGGTTKPFTTEAMFAASSPGVYRWSCHMLCDGDAKNWSMYDADGRIVGQVGFMAGTITAV